MNWEDLSPEEQNKWDELAEDDKVKTLVFLYKLKKCWMCKHKFKETFLITKNNEPLISGEWAFHFDATHGIPPDSLPYIITS